MSAFLLSENVSEIRLPTIGSRARYSFFNPLIDFRGWPAAKGRARLLRARIRSGSATERMHGRAPCMYNFPHRQPRATGQSAGRSSQYARAWARSDLDKVADRGHPECLGHDPARFAGLICGRTRPRCWAMTSCWGVSSLPIVSGRSCSSMPLPSLPPSLGVPLGNQRRWNVEQLVMATRSLRALDPMPLPVSVEPKAGTPCFVVSATPVGEFRLRRRLQRSRAVERQCRQVIGGFSASLGHVFHISHINFLRD